MPSKWSIKLVQGSWKVAPSRNCESTHLIAAVPNFLSTVNTCSGLSNDPPQPGCLADAGADTEGVPLSCRRAGHVQISGVKWASH